MLSLHFCFPPSPILDLITSPSWRPRAKQIHLDTDSPHSLETTASGLAKDACGFHFLVFTQWNLYSPRVQLTALSCARSRAPPYGIQSTSHSLFQRYKIG